MLQPPALPASALLLLGVDSPVELVDAVDVPIPPVSPVVVVAADVEVFADVDVDADVVPAGVVCDGAAEEFAGVPLVPVTTPDGDEEQDAANAATAAHAPIDTSAKCEEPDTLERESMGAWHFVTGGPRARRLSEVPRSAGPYGHGRGRGAQSRNRKSSVPRQLTRAARRWLGRHSAPSDAALLSHFGIRMIAFEFVQ